ncbi:twitching motility protein PilT [Spirochaetia bacterium]|nr:twitching motility protein PilT [Spirochaetia bacterium]
MKSYAAEPQKKYPSRVYVFDSSFIGALIIPDEKSQRLRKLYAAIQNEDEKYAPKLIWYEMANIFNNLIRRKRYTYDEVLDFIPLLSALHITSDSAGGVVYTEKLLRLSREYDLSSYDAAYLELAGRKKAVLATLDEGLQAAAVKYGVTLLR